MLLGTLDASVLRNLLTGKGIIRAGEGRIRAGEALLKQVRIFNVALSVNTKIIKKNLYLMVFIQKKNYLK